MDLQAADFFIKLFDLIFRILVISVIPILGFVIREIIKLRTDQKLLEQKTCTLQEKLDALPGEESRKELAVTLERLNGTVNGMGAVLQRLEKVVDRHEDYLQQRG